MREFILYLNCTKNIHLIPAGFLCVSDKMNKTKSYFCIVADSVDMEDFSMEEKCFFKWKFKCGKVAKGKGLSNVTAKRIENIIKCSKQYEDNIHVDLQTKYNSDKNLVAKAHRSCVDKYCHPHEVKKAQKHKQAEGEGTSEIPKKRSRRSETPQFCFQQHCFYCGEICMVDKDFKNPTRWRPAFVCRQTDRTEGNFKSLKQEILEKCEERNDNWAR